MEPKFQTWEETALYRQDRVKPLEEVVISPQLEEE